MVTTIHTSFLVSALLIRLKAISMADAILIAQQQANTLLG